VAETSFPFQTGAGTAVTEARWKAMAARWMGSGVIGAAFRGAADTSLKPSIPGGGSGPTFGLTAGEAYLDGLVYDNSAPLTKSAINNASGNPRIDRLVLKRDTTAKTITAHILEGATAASPDPPALTGSSTVSYLAIARATVAGGGTTYSNMVDERVFTGVRHLVGPETGSGAAMTTGDTWFQADTGIWMMHTGADVIPVAEVLLGLGAKLETDQDPGSGTTASSGFTETRSGGVSVVGTSFIAPLSGTVLVYLNCGISTPSSSVIGSCSVRIGSGATLAGGTEIEPPSLDRALQHSGVEDQQGRTDPVEELTPGGTYNATVMFRSNVPTSTFSRCSITVQPVLA
jgi:hypothetical protein